MVIFHTYVSLPGGTPIFDCPSPDLGHIEVATHASTLVRADRCSVFLVDERTVRGGNGVKCSVLQSVKKAQMTLVEFSNLETQY